MNGMQSSCVALWLVSLAMTGVSNATEPASRRQFTEGERLFAITVAPLLREKCLVCHGADPKDIRGGLDLRSREGLLSGGDSGTPSLVPGDPEKSPLHVAVTWQDADLQMPPKENDRLTVTQIGAIARWISAGAPWLTDSEIRTAQSDWDAADGVQVITSGGLTADWTNRRYDSNALWAYRPMQIAHVPDVASVPHPIDRFIVAEWNQFNLTGTGRADRRTLVRRVTFDLTGLPPTLDEIDAFTADERPDAFERLVERLLASPAYGERSAQHWLDVTRYADTNGFANDFERPNAWRYRDYVIRSFTADKPYNDFVVEQLAGDQVRPDDPEMSVAVGFLRSGPWEHTGMSVAAITRQQYLDDVVNAVGEVFLAHGLRCCKCHDHKFDPIPTRDYYRLMAVFRATYQAEKPLEFLPTENTAGFDQERELVQGLIDATSAQIEAYGRKSFEAGIAWLKERGVDTSGFAAPKGGFNTYANLFGKLPTDQRPPRNVGLDYTDLGVIKVLTKRREHLSRIKERFEPVAFTVYDGATNSYLSNKIRNLPASEKVVDGESIRILAGGSLESPLDPVEPGILSVIGNFELQMPDTGFRQKVERSEGIISSEELAARGSTASASQTSDPAIHSRLDLARWISDKRNPLTARVIANRIWQQHFSGRGLVASANNFGRMGKRPTHPELLDFLAQYLIEHDWSLKDLHRLIVSSQTYQRSGRHPEMPRGKELDPNNELLTFYPPRRLSAEEIRDAMLAASGELVIGLGGPGVFPCINTEVALQPRHVMGSVAPAYQPSPSPQQRNRRALYAFRIRGLPDPLLEVFNRPNSDVSCERRDATTITPQVFALFNGQNSYDRALALARRIEECCSDETDRIKHAFLFTFGREPSRHEANVCTAHLQNMFKQHERTPLRPVPLPKFVKRSMVEEMTGVSFSWDEPLDAFASGFVDDLKAWQVGPATRALADVCLVLMNSNEFLYID